MMALAVEFTKRKISFSFALKFDDFWIGMLLGKGYTVQKIDSSESLSAWIVKRKVTHVVYDTRNDFGPEDLRSLRRKHDVKIIAIDSPEDVRLAADAAIYPPIPQVNEWSWKEFAGKIYCGWEYVLLRSEFAEAVVKRNTSNRVILSFGSTDPYKLSEWAISEIEANRHLFDGLKFTLMVGPQFDRLEQLRSTGGFTRLDFDVIQSPPDIVSVFQSAKFALIALGVTAYELASLRVPFLFASISDDHARSGEAFEKNGLGFSLGTIGKSMDGFHDKVQPFISGLDRIKDNIDEFSKQNKISNWTKIINAITE